jgi:hypothetical protein
MNLFKNISDNFSKRIIYYTLCILPSLGFFINFLTTSEFNVDEFQHNYLAWASSHFDQIQYRDFWDNHGILYTLFNSIFIKIFNPEIGVATLMLERWLSFALFIIGSYILLEIFYEISSKVHYASLGILFLSYGMIPSKIIEIRPDNLQCLFLYLGLLTLLKSLKGKNKKLAFISGILISLMLMVNLKSLSALIGIAIALIIYVFKEKNKEINHIVLNFSYGILSGLFAFGLGFASLGILDDYFKCNILFIIQCGKLGLWAANKQTLMDYYAGPYLFLSICLILSIIFFLVSSIQEIKKHKYEKLIISSLVICCLMTRSIYVFWQQFDIIYLPITSCFLSYVFFQLFDCNIHRLLKNFIWVILLCLFVLLTFSSFAKLLNNHDVKLNYFQTVDQRFKDISKFVKPGEYTDYFIPDNCPGHGFTRNLSYLIQKYHQTIYLWERIEKQELYGRHYIEELNNKKVRLIIASRRGIYSTQHFEAAEYIANNYKYYDCIWERVTPFQE